MTHEHRPPIPCPGGFGAPPVRFVAVMPPDYAEGWVVRWLVRTSVATADFAQVPALRVTGGQRVEVALDHVLVGESLPHCHAEPPSTLAVAAIVRLASGSRLSLIMTRTYEADDGPEPSFHGDTV